MENNQETIKLITDFGLVAEEAKIVAFLSDNLDVSVSGLSKNLGISRSTIYRLLDNLEDQGWIQYILTNQGKNVRLADLASLEWILEEKKEQLKQKETALKALLDKAHKLIEEEKAPMSVRYYEGRGGLRQTYWNTQKSISMLRVLTSLVRRKLVGDKWLERHLLEFSRLNIPVRIIGDKEYAKFAYKEYENRAEYY
ncbi:helix-turn-helix domain-containing protein, partial [Candidatus Dojkabacteria bacterium]|nr:helix-turn-helix domain-containing protein [Candidatus Dojkabacteria bacterium]